jgi:hypothetical protein
MPASFYVTERFATRIEAKETVFNTKKPSTTGRGVIARVAVSGSKHSMPVLSLRGVSRFRVERSRINEENKL